MSITSADAVLTFTQAVLFSTPQQLQNFAVDDIYDTDQIKSIEAQMGVDGNLSFGFVFVPVMQNFNLMADSPSISIFEQIFGAQQAAKTVYPINGSILLPSLGKKYIMTNGGLSGYKPTPDAKRVLQAMKFQVTWQSVLPAPA
jgi:hypothetical protein